MRYCKLLLPAFIFFTLFSCEKEVTLNLSHEPTLCLNCILNPDSMISASLSISKALNASGDFESVNNASVLLYEDGSLFGELQRTGNGNYRLNKKPSVSKNYKIVAQAPGYTSVTATTIVPRFPEVATTRDTTAEELNPQGIHSTYSYIVFDLNVQLFDKPGADNYWLYSSWIVNDRRYGGGCHPINAPFVDTFNRIIDSEEKYGFRHFLQIRIFDEGYDGETLAFTIPDFVKYSAEVNNELGYQYFLNADEHYDKYIKTTIMNRMKETSELPFYEPIQIYSNIENGYGIFGSCAITAVKL